MDYLNYNGKTLPADSLLVGADNRGLRFGDGLFETIKYKHHQLILLDEHLARLWNGMKALQFDIPKLFTPDVIEAHILSLLKKNNHANARIRLAIIRGNGGLYDASSNAPNYIIQTWSLPESNGILNENGLQLCIYRDAVKAIDSFSNLKHNNYLPYFMGAQYAKTNKCNDAIILNQSQRICDTTIANLFVIKENEIYTPSLSEGCVAGVMRHFIIEELKKMGHTVIEKEMTEKDLLEAEEIFLTNSIYNIRWVGSIGNKMYKQHRINEIYSQLQQTNRFILC